MYMRIPDETQITDEQKIGWASLEPMLQFSVQKLGHQIEFRTMIWSNESDTYLLVCAIDGKRKLVEVSEADLEDSAYSTHEFRNSLLRNKLLPQLLT